MNIALNDINLKQAYGNSIHRNLYPYYCNPCGWCNRTCCNCYRAQTKNGNGKTWNDFDKNQQNSKHQLRLYRNAKVELLGVLPRLHKSFEHANLMEYEGKTATFENCLLKSVISD